MKKYFSIFIISVCALTLSACETTYQYWTYGVGVKTCTEWAAERNDEYDTYVSTWVMGWVSGAGRYIGVELEKADHEIMMAWIENYCTENPDKTIKEAAEFLVKQLQKSSPESTPIFVPLFIPQYNY